LFDATDAALLIKLFTLDLKQKLVIDFHKHDILQYLLDADDSVRFDLNLSEIAPRREGRELGPSEVVFVIGSEETLLLSPELHSGCPIKSPAPYT
jgi:hypothetical protein